MKINEWMYQSVIGVLVVIILLLAWWIVSHPGLGVFPASGTSMSTTTSNVTSPSTVKGSSSMSQSTSPTTEARGESVSIANQQASKEVAVSALTLSQPSWVTIRDSNGRILGAAWVSTGTHSKVSVPLLRATMAGQKYQVQLYADNGDRKFDTHADILITGAGGAVAGTTFTAQ